MRNLDYFRGFCHVSVNRPSLTDLIADAGEDSLSSSTANTSNTPGEVARPVRAARKGCAILPSFSPSASRMGADCRIKRFSRPFAHCFQNRIDRLQYSAAFIVEQGCGFFVQRERAVGKMNFAPSASSTSVFARSFSPGIASRSCARPLSSRASASSLAAFNFRQNGNERIKQRLIVA